VLLARLRTQADLKRARDELLHHAEHLEAEVAQRTRETLAVQDATIMAMATLAETRDHETGNHIRRTQLYVKALATALAPNPRFAAFCTPKNIDLLFKSAPLHDIGKVGVPDHILLKPGKLTPEEFEQMKLHTTYGRDAILAAEKLLGAEASFLSFAREIAYSHQEKWDGSGYPLGLVGDDIPVSARIMAVGDVYDALISARVYKPAFSHGQAMDILLKGRGSHFDPDMVDAFISIEAEIREIAARYSDAAHA
jgi:putative two-component system response regulator